MKLFRGDTVFNTLTEPHTYRFDGIRTKVFGRGDPAYIEKNGLLESMRRHINPIYFDQKDIGFYNTTEFISFSKDIKRAMFWLRNQDTVNVCDSKDSYSETRYLFEMNIPDHELEEKETGVYSFKFQCNPSLKIPNIADPILWAIREHMYGVKDCSICHMGNKNHELLLIDTTKYLGQYAKYEKYNGAIKYAEEDQEWLVLPSDQMPDGRFNSARIPRADFWTVKHYNVLGEKRPGFERQGFIHDHT